MDNHFHAILSGPDLAETMGNLKKFTAKRLLEQLAVERREWLLKDLHFYRAAHKTRSEHQVWQEGVHPKAVVSDEMMLQKLEYVHNNPVQRGWVAAPEHWRYSSAQRMVPWCDTGAALRPVAMRAAKQSFVSQGVTKQEFRHERNLA
jgi:putative transposase